VRRYDALGFPRRSAGVEDHRRPVRRKNRDCPGFRTTGTVPVSGEQIRRADEAGAVAGGNFCQGLRLAAAADNDRCLGVADDVFELRGGMGNRERDGDAASPPDPALHDDERETGRDEKGDARIPQIAGAFGEHLRDGRGRRSQVLVREHAVGGDDGKAVASDVQLSL